MTVQPTLFTTESTTLAAVRCEALPPLCHLLHEVRYKSGMWYLQHPTPEFHGVGVELIKQRYGVDWGGVGWDWGGGGLDVYVHVYAPWCPHAPVSSEWLYYPLPMFLYVPTPFHPPCCVHIHSPCLLCPHPFTLLVVCFVQRASGRHRGGLTVQAH